LRAAGQAFVATILNEARSLSLGMAATKNNYCHTLFEVDPESKTLNNAERD